jgi:hypothetical protein
VTRALVVGVVAAFACAAGAAPAEAGPLETAIADPLAFAGPSAATAFERTRAAGATSVRLVLDWSSVAPTAPLGDASDPADGAYQWAPFDRQIAGAAAAGLRPIVCITRAPTWARDVAAGGPRTSWPRPAQLAAFAAAAARRYAGFNVAWQIWNEPNHRAHLRPQFRGNVPVSVARYRAMVNMSARAIHRVNGRAVVAAGALAPFGHRAVSIEVVPPLEFMRRLLCMSRDARPRRTCRTKVEFDVWSHHPYTQGGPTHHAPAASDVSLGDLPSMNALLRAAVRAGQVESTRRVRFWVTEFSWDSRPEDPRGVPLALHGRWVAEALYRMWRAGVDLVTWWRVNDDPLASSPYQSGLYLGSSARPKPAFTAFRFPFVAFRRAAGVRVWGRIPPGRDGPVLVERLTRDGHWSRVAAVRPDRYGMFQRTLPATSSAALRARLADASESSLAFALTPPRAGKRYTVFGCGGPIPCGR